jgi:anti-sigma factor (TIGR02949 family)
MSILDRFRRGVPDGPIDCRAVGRRLQAVLDGEAADDIADRVAEHLEACRHCGLEADTYLRIKSTLSRSAPLDEEAEARLRAFGHALAVGRIDR